MVAAITEKVVKGRADMADGNYKAAGESFGEAGHTIADSFSASHTERDSNGNITLFHNYSEQGEAEHGEADKMDNDALFEGAVSANEKLLRYALSDDFTLKGMQDLLRKEIIPITKDTKVGAGTNDKYKEKKEDDEKKKKIQIRK